jgi:hypothetical protein
MKRLSWKYLAGLIDGEGCIDVQVTNQVYVRPRLRIAMTDVAEDILVLCQNSYGGHICRRESKNPNWSDALSWEASGYKQACIVLRNVVNHLILKREQARFCLWMETNLKGKQVSTEVRDAVREELKLMKRDSHRLSEKAQERILGML